MPLKMYRISSDTHLLIMSGFSLKNTTTHGFLHARILWDIIFMAHQGIGIHSSDELFYLCCNQIHLDRTAP